jgi:hypothetical protein
MNKIDAYYLGKLILITNFLKFFLFISFNLKFSH